MPPQSKIYNLLIFNNLISDFLFLIRSSLPPVKAIFSHNHEEYGERVKLTEKRRLFGSRLDRTCQ